MKPHRPLLLIESVEDRVLPSGLGLAQLDSNRVGAADAFVSTMAQPSPIVVSSAADPVSAYHSSLPSGGIALNRGLSGQGNDTDLNGTRATGLETSDTFQNLNLNGVGTGYSNSNEDFEPIIVTPVFTSAGWVFEVFGLTGVADETLGDAPTQPSASDTNPANSSGDSIATSKPDGLPSDPEATGSSENTNPAAPPSFADGPQGSPVLSQFLAAAPTSINTTVATVSRDTADSHTVSDAATNLLASMPTQASTAALPATFIGLTASAPQNINFPTRTPDLTATSAKPLAAPLAETPADAEPPAILVAADPPADGPIPALAFVDASALGDQVSSVLSYVSGLGLDPNIELPQPDVYTWVIATGLMSAGAGYAVWVGRKSPQPTRIPLVRGPLAGWEDRE